MKNRNWPYIIGNILVSIPVIACAIFILLSLVVAWATYPIMVSIVAGVVLLGIIGMAILDREQS